MSKTETVMTITRSQFSSLEGGAGIIREQAIELLSSEELSTETRNKVNHLINDADQLAQQLYTLGEIS